MWKLRGDSSSGTSLGCNLISSQMVTLDACFGGRMRRVQIAVARSLAAILHRLWVAGTEFEARRSGIFQHPLQDRGFDRHRCSRASFHLRRDPRCHQGRLLSGAGDPDIPLLSRQPEYQCLRPRPIDQRAFCTPPGDRPEWAAYQAYQGFLGICYEIGLAAFKDRLGLDRMGDQTHGHGRIAASFSGARVCPIGAYVCHALPPFGGAEMAWGSTIRRRPSPSPK